MAKNITNADRQFTAPVKAWHTNNNIPKNSITGAMNSKMAFRTRRSSVTVRAERIWRNPDPLSAALDCEGFLSAVAGRALSFIPEKERLKQPAGKEYAELFAWLEQKDASAEITVTDLADFMNMRRESFSRKFTRDFRISPKQFLARQLLRKASEMLSNPSQPVREIAKALHFSSEYYFSRFFREHTGMPPGEFRRIHGEKSELIF